MKDWFCRLGRKPQVSYPGFPFRRVPLGELPGALVTDLADIGVIVTDVLHIGDEWYYVHVTLSTQAHESEHGYNCAGMIYCYHRRRGWECLIPSNDPLIDMFIALCSRHVHSQELADEKASKLLEGIMSESEED